MAEELTQKERVCIGNRLNSKGKVEPFWMELNENDEAVGNSFSFTKPLKGARTGNIYLFTGKVDEEGRFTFYMKGEHAPRYSAQYARQPTLLAWQTEDKKAVLVEALKKQQAKTGGELLASLKPIKDAYRNSNTQGRAALLALVIQEITKI